MSDLAISTRELGKRYRRGLQLEPYKTAREALVRMARRPFHGPAEARTDDRWFWALRDVSFELEEGEALGVIGRNGAGKTTLLKLLGRITRPTAGEADVCGRVGILLEVGTAFHPELTGRENIKLNGAILGMSRVDIERRFDEIVEFAEVEKFIDTPVKRYSSGMFVRLAFSVAAHMEPDILIVDEVLAVGDAAFQRKCLGKLDEAGSEGRTVIFVSHNMAAVAQLCSRAILLDGGRVTADGPVGSVVDAYMAGVGTSSEEVRFQPDPESAASFVRLTTLREDGRASARFESVEPVVLEAELEVGRRVSGDHCWFVLQRADRVMVLAASDDDHGRTPPDTREPGRYVIRFVVPGNLLNEGTYQFRVCFGKRRGVYHDDRLSGYFDVEDVNDYTRSDFGKRPGVVLVPVGWEETRVG